MLMPRSPPANAVSRLPSAPRKRLFLLPLRMPGGEPPDAIEHDTRLEAHRLLGPERAVVVERGNMFGRRHKVRPALLGDLVNEGHDVLLGCPVVPRRQEIGLRLRIVDQDEYEINGEIAPRRSHAALCKPRCTAGPTQDPGHLKWCTPDRILRLLSARSRLDLLLDLFQIERARRLARRVVLHGHEELAGQRL